MEKRMYKSDTNKVIFGTCGGIAEYFNIDPIVIRVIFVVLFFTGLSGLLIYIVASLIIPKSPFEDFDEFERINKEYHEKPKRKNRVKGDDEFDSYFKD